MGIQEFIVILGIVIAPALFIWKEISSLRSELKIDMSAQAARTDKLYEMFIDLLKQKNGH